MINFKPIAFLLAIIILIVIVVINFPTSDSMEKSIKVSTAETAPTEAENLESGDSPQNVENPQEIDSSENQGQDAIPTTAPHHKITKIIDGIMYRTAEIQPNQGLFQSLFDIGLNSREALKVINGLRFEVDLISLRAGAQFDIGMIVYDSTMYAADSNITSYDSVKVVSVRYKTHPALIHHLKTNDNDSLVYSKEEKKTHFKYRFYTNTLKPGSSLNNMLLDAGLPPNLTQTVNGVLLCKISFRTDAQPNDKFKVLIRDEYYQDTLISGKVLYTSYEGINTGFYQAFRYDDGDKSSYTAHYTFDGEALVHSGMRYPVDRLHISSNYGWRTHPVTGQRKFHYGVDYASGNRSLVYAVAPGRVVKSTYDKYSGNYIAIKHADNSQSYYLHLSTRSVNVGTNVRSKQVIGRVGATGRVTGPHLHFGIKKPNGQWMNPNQKRMIATPKLEGEHYQKLLRQIAEIFPILSDLESHYDYKQRMKDAGFTLSSDELKDFEFDEEAIDSEIQKKLQVNE